MLISAIVFITIDFIYLNMMKDYFDNQIKKIQGTKIEMNFLGAALCYIFLIYGLNYFIIKPRKTVSEAFLLGLVIYSVYEFTTWSLLKNWKMQTVIIDSLWGAILFTLTTAIVYKVYL